MSPVDRESSSVVERQHAEWFLAERVVSGVEVHEDRDITWLVHAGHAWLRALVSASDSRTRAFVAWLDDEPVGAIEVFVGSHSAGIHALTVIDEYQGRGIGSALVEHACTEARLMGSATIGLLSSTEGQPLYLRRGFREVAKFGYWYRSFQRGC